MAFLKTLFIRLHKNSIPVLALAANNLNSSEIYQENQWLQFLDSITNSNNFKTFILPPLNGTDIETYIEALIPGANRNLINFVASNTLKDPFYIALYINFLKQQSIIKSVDQKYWWLNDTAVLLDSAHLKSNEISSLVTSLVQNRISDEVTKRIGTVLFFYNNVITQEELENIIGEIDPLRLVQSGLFHIIFKEGAVIFSFYHDLFYSNFSNLLTQDELILFAAQLLLKGNIKRTDVLGKLYEYVGDFLKSRNEYLKFASEQLPISPFKALLYYEKTLDISMPLTLSNEVILEDGTKLPHLIFIILDLYERYNFLSDRKSFNLFALLKKHSDFNQLTVEETIRYYYYLGIKYTKEENFIEAKSYFKQSCDYLSSAKAIPQDLIDKAVSSLGINLKHIGEKEKSIAYFENAAKKWNSRNIRYEQYSNIASYYLTSNPEKSLEYYSKMKKEFGVEESIHLLIDFAMAKFYLGRMDEAQMYLDRALPLSRKKINLPEEARAENILGILNWINKKLNIAEAYLDTALSNGELANNHRWIWRIKTNLAQVAFYNNNSAKAYNLCWAVAEHLLKTKEVLIFEANNKNISSRRFASIKAIASVLFKMEMHEDLKKLNHLFSIPSFSIFLEALNVKNDISFDRNDTNLFDKDYYILG